ncbi:uncharacterized protein LOC109858845 [Pseudomyrmex gracilis]|uniref:uncharacterized protein LOC109858845 n=1 Tax=Pseudomyrmex gracilis TaxID=219809 RepID=UPI0009954D93|nr:uncharacterized protein LOC109858845 [Pseudomyrmex gracilis]XP_020292089.1 uncharacterized protein LOC109858845 [Pseudomyrmex gracilis]XP_020292090.1 uncharacterized protein LOC109858845 [Pseudomyrmex gracilis]
MVSMEDVTDPPVQNHRKKSITINTKTPPRSSKSSIKSPRKSILRKSGNSFSESNGDVQMTNGGVERTNDTSQRSSALVSSGPNTLEELIKKETLTEKNISSTFNLEDISDSEEIWIMDLPKLIDPQELCGQTIALEDKSKIKIKDERYSTVANNVNHNVTCVFNTEKGYKTVNINAVGTLSVRRKLSEVLELKPVSRSNSDVQFPYNLKPRHASISVANKHDMSSRKKKSKKRSSFKL